MTDSCLYCERPVTRGCRHPTPADFTSVVDELAKVRRGSAGIETQDHGAVQFRRHLRIRLRDVKIASHDHMGGRIPAPPTKEGWDEAIDYVLDILRSTPLPSEWAARKSERAMGR